MYRCYQVRISGAQVDTGKSDLQVPLTPYLPKISAPPTPFFPLHSPVSLLQPCQFSLHFCFLLPAPMHSYPFFPPLFCLIFFSVPLTSIPLFPSQFLCPPRHCFPLFFPSLLTSLSFSVSMPSYSLFPPLSPAFSCPSHNPASFPLLVPMSSWFPVSPPPTLPPPPLPPSLE